MRERLDGSTLDQVLLDFEISCPTPSVADVERWQAANPDYATEILRSAVLTSKRVLAGVGEGEPTPDPRDEALVSELLEAHMASRRREVEGIPLTEHLARTGTSMDDLEGAMGLRSGVLGAVVSEGLGGPVPERLAREVGKHLGVSPEIAAASLAIVPPGAVWRHAASRSAPPRRLRTFAEAIGATDMSDERKAFWLEDG